MHRRGSFHLVLVADGSTATDAAARAVRDLIDPAAIGRIFVVAVGSPLVFAGNWTLGMLGFLGPVPQALVDDLWRQANAWATAESERVAGLLGVVVPAVVPVARVGNPVEEIVAAARELEADLIVVGRDGGGRRRLARRDVAGELMRRASRPVLVVRPGIDEAPPSGKRVPEPGRRVALPAGGTFASAGA
jgi:nucleotide-binding universal stress UspA family protein